MPFKDPLKRKQHDILRNKIRYNTIYKFSKSYKKSKRLYDKEYNQRPHVIKRRQKQMRVFGKKYRLNIKCRVIGHYSKGKMKCLCCGETIMEFLTIDKFIGTSNHKKITGSGIRLYIWLIKHDFPKGYRVMCFNCNCGRGRGICPHKK